MGRKGGRGKKIYSVTHIMFTVVIISIIPPGILTTRLLNGSVKRSWSNKMYNKKKSWDLVSKWEEKRWNIHPSLLILK